MATRHTFSVVFVIFATLSLGTSASSGESPKSGESNVEEKVKTKIRVSGELTITDEKSPKKEKVKNKIEVSGELKVMDESDKTTKNNWKISGWGGYSSYKMNQFNDKLSSENNETISGGLNIGLEITPKKFALDSSGLIKLLGLSIVKTENLELPTTFPIGFEYLEAKSRTIHDGSTTVNWELPVTGVYFSPEIRVLGKDEATEGFSLKWRPFGVGYYTLGKLIDAKLNVTGEPGHLEVSGEDLGFTTLAALQYKQKEDFEIFLEGGYRWLEFTDVLREPKGGFAGGAPASQLPEDLDYSGFIVRGGLIWRF